MKYSILKTYHIIALSSPDLLLPQRVKHFENFQVMSFFENEGLQYGVLQLMCHTFFFTQMVIRKAKTGSLHSAGNMVSCGLQS